MKLVLTITGPGGEVAELPVDEARMEIITQPGHRYRLNASDPQQPATSGTLPTNPVIGNPRALRVDDDLILDQLPAGYPVQLRNFFANCTAEASCELVIDVPGAKIAAITPLSEPLAAYAEGGFLMYTATPVASTTMPMAPDAEPTFNWRPIAALGGGLAIAASVGSSGGGGVVASDSAVTGAPQVTSGLLTNSATPVLSGTADPGSSVRMTLQITDPSGTTTVGYSTQADPDGNWSISTLTGIPTSGQFPADGLQPGQTASISLVSTGVTGRVSAVVNDAIVLDTTPPAQPLINLAGDLSASTSAQLNGVAVIDATESADGVLINGSAEAGSAITIVINGPDAYRFSEQVAADQNGQFSLLIAAQSLPADGTLSLSVRATDTAGNTGPAFQAPVILDKTLSDAVVDITSINDDRAPVIGQVINTTNDTTPTVSGTVVGALAADEHIELLRDGDLVGVVLPDGQAWTLTDNLNANETGPEGTYVYSARIVDNAGNAGNGGALGLESTTATITVDTTAPAQLVTISAVIDDNGPTPVNVPNGGYSADLTPTIRVSLSDVLASGESLQLFRSQNGAITTFGVTSGADGSDRTIFEFQDSLLDSGSLVGYQAQIVDSVGLASAPSAAYTIQVQDPLENIV